jgi:hypothetical protein
MTLEFVPEGGRDAPLLLISGAEPSTLSALRAAAWQLTSGAEQEIAAQELPGFASADGCGLMMTNSPGKPGVKQVEGLRFRWVQDREGWAQVAELIDPFLRPRPTGSFQLLESGDISVILSTDGKW